MSAALSLLVLPLISSWLGPLPHVHPSIRRSCAPCCSRAVKVLSCDTRICKDAKRASRGGKRLRVQLSHSKKKQLISMHKQAQAHIRKGATEPARALLDKCLALDRGDAHSWLTLARLEASCGRQAVAHNLFKQARAACPGNVRLIHAHAILEQRRGRAPEARRLFEEATLLQPANEYTGHAWGRFEESLGNRSGAMEIYARTSALEAHPLVCAAWAKLEAQSGKFDAARAICEQGLGSKAFGLGGMAGGGTTPSRTELLTAWAGIEDAAGNMSGARRLLELGESLSLNEPHVSLAALCSIMWLHGLSTCDVDNRAWPLVFAYARWRRFTSCWPNWTNGWAM